MTKCFKNIRTKIIEILSSVIKLKLKMFRMFLGHSVNACFAENVGTK